jgi:CPA1 family monovalent cation:H+ antiporter
VQGFTIRPLIALLRIAPDESLGRDVAEARRAMLDAAVGELSGRSGASADAVRNEYAAVRAANVGSAKPPTEYDHLRLLALAAERKVLHEWRWKGRILDDVYHLLEDELDRAELQAASVGTTWLEG